VTPPATSPALEIEGRVACLPRELLDSTLFLLARVGMRMKGRVLEEFEQAGFSMYQYSVLAILSEGACERQSTMADVIGLDRSQLVGVLDSLEERGLVERRRDPNDRRRHLVSLTAAGERQLVKLRAIVQRIESAVLEPLDDDTRKSLHETLLTVAAHGDARFKRPS
jgi:DNA-binding MarR family transcriptional regulator